ncbi:MAG: tetratricopeptide repeat protein, partial [Planctomycetota bacterium]
MINRPNIVSFVPDGHPPLRSSGVAKPKGRRMAVVLLFLAGLGLVAFNWHTQVFGQGKANEAQQESDLDFADRLVEESVPGGLNFLDIAEEMVQDILKSGASKKVQQHATLILGKLKKFNARMERDQEKRVQLMNEAVDILDKFVKENADYSGVSEAKFEMVDLLQEKARNLSGGVKVETDPSKKQGLIEQAEATYNRINDDLNAAITDYQKALIDITDTKKRDEIDNKMMRAYYAQALNFYFKALMYNKGDENQKKCLQGAIKLFNGFALKYGEKLLIYEASDYIGLCYYELGDNSKAKSYFRMTANLYNIIMKDDELSAEDKKSIISEEKDTIQRGYTHLAMVANANGEYSEAIKNIDELIKIFPKDLSDEWMEMALLEKARALFETGKKEEAFKIIQDTKNNTRSGMVRSGSNEMLNVFMRRGVDDPAMIVSTMRDFLIRSKYDDVVQQGQFLMNMLNRSADDKRIQFLPEALLIMAEAFKAQDRFYESIILYETVYLNPKYKDAKSSQKEDVAPMAAQGAAVAYLKMSAEAGDEADRAKYRETLEYLTKTWPNSIQAREFQFFQGKQNETEGKFPEAAVAYDKVPGSSPFYYESRFRIGRMYHLQADGSMPSYRKEKDAKKKDEAKAAIIRTLGLAEDAYKKALKFYDEKSKEPLDEESKNKISHNELQTRLFLSRMYLNDFLSKYSEILEILGGLEKKYGSRADAVREILQLKIEAYINMDDLGKAEAHFKSFQEYARKDNNPEITAPAMQMMALAYNKKADGIVPPLTSSSTKDRINRTNAINEKKEKSADEYKKLVDALQRSGEYFSQWVEIRKKTILPDEVLTVAENLLQFAEDIERNDFYKKAADLYDRALNKEFQGRLPRQETWLIKWRQTKALRALGEKEKAVSILEELDLEKKNNIDIKRELAFAYEDAGSKDNPTPWQSARKKWAEISALYKSGTEEWWEAKYRFVFMDYKMGNFKEALYAMSTMKQAVNPDYDNNKWGYNDKFTELARKIEDET